ncbi:hypothetical protein QBC37DRAFT_459177 [Rhypophila decipiens]|uniref:Uncharacterized protein n=1 Tax=Rhypophila decipiens TaxID=261697 RepID=A0AAN6YAX0_9PEZI|nr:hypothetical protein QBC37DRAFT_459177 [Rhypophila decipiens]
MMIIMGESIISRLYLAPRREKANNQNRISVSCFSGRQAPNALRENGLKHYRIREVVQKSPSAKPGIAKRLVSCPSQFLPGLRACPSHFTSPAVAGFELHFTDGDHIDARPSQAPVYTSGVGSRRITFLRLSITTIVPIIGYWFAGQRRVVTRIAHKATRLLGSAHNLQLDKCLIVELTSRRFFGVVVIVVVILEDPDDASSRHSVSRLPINKVHDGHDEHHGDLEMDRVLVFRRQSNRRRYDVTKEQRTREPGLASRGAFRISNYDREGSAGVVRRGLHAGGGKAGIKALCSGVLPHKIEMDV